MAAGKITLYLDIVSPFAYIAYYVTRHSPIFKKCDITYVPVFLGGIMKECGNTPPIRIKNKDKWINIERLRWAKILNVPVVENTPEGFPPMTLSTQRTLCAVSALAPEKLVPSFDALYHSFWVEGNSKIGQPEGYMPVLERVLGKNGAAEALKSSSTPETKGILSSNTEKAMASGAFGLPWFECTNSAGKTEGFWGVDHMGQVAQFMGLDSSADKGFRAMM